MKCNDSGLSILELIIAVSIIAILAAVLTPQYLKYVTKAKKATDIESAMERRQDEQSYCYDQWEAGEI